jgi:uncharacterized membrane protein
LKLRLNVIAILLIVSGVFLPAIGGPMWGWLVVIVLGAAVSSATGTLMIGLAMIISGVLEKMKSRNTERFNSQGIANR